MCNSSLLWGVGEGGMLGDGVKKRKKQWYVPSANCLLVIGIKRPTYVCYHTGELTPGKVGFFSASAESQRRSFLSQQ